MWSGILTESYSGSLLSTNVAIYKFLNLIFGKYLYKKLLDAHVIDLDLLTQSVRSQLILTLA